MNEYHHYIPDSAVFFEIYRIWYKTVLNFPQTAAQKCEPTRRFTVQGKIPFELAINEKENARRLLRMKIILPAST
jgi:hypothetical protein